MTDSTPELETEAVESMRARSVWDRKYREAREFLASDRAHELQADHREAGRDVLGRKAGHIVAPEDRQPIRPETHGLWTGMDDKVNCPPTYDIWYRQYRKETLYWVNKVGVNYREIYEVADEIMTRFMERDSLGVFRREWKTRSKSGRSRFQSYYSKFVIGYASGKHRNNVRHVMRNHLLLDAPASDDGTTWYELNAPAAYDTVAEDVEFGELVAELRGRVPDPDVVDAVLFLAEDGRVTQGKLAEQMGLSETRAAKPALDAVRAALRDLVGEDAVRGRKRA